MTSSLEDPDDEKRRWFGPKTIGFGIQPTSWQGWLVTAVAVTAALGAVKLSFWILHGGIGAAVAAGISIIVIFAIYFRLIDRHSSPGSGF